MHVIMSSMLGASLVILYNWWGKKCLVLFLYCCWFSEVLSGKISLLRRIIFHFWEWWVGDIYIDIVLLFTLNINIIMIRNISSLILYYIKLKFLLRLIYWTRYINKERVRGYSASDWILYFFEEEEKWGCEDRAMRFPHEWMYTIAH